MPLDLGSIVGDALENTLDAKGLTYAIKDANEIVLKTTYVAADSKFENYQTFTSSGEYQIHDIYVSDKDYPREVGGSTMQDVLLTLKRDNTVLLDNYRIIMGIETVYAIHNGNVISFTLAFPSGVSAPTSDTDYYLHLRVLQLVPPS